MANPNPPRENLRPKPWKPGQSGNPAGYSRKRRITDALLELLDEKGADRKLALKWLERSLKGDPKFFAMLLDRVEGKVPQPVDVKAEASNDIRVEFIDGNSSASATAQGAGDDSESSPAIQRRRMWEALRQEPTSDPPSDRDGA